MKLPVIDCDIPEQGPGSYGECLSCGVGIPNASGTFAFLNAGALRRIDAKNAEPAEDLVGFLVMGLHGGDAGRASGAVTVVNDSPQGQFEFSYCSTDCLRTFLNRCVDALEEKVGVSQSRA